MTVMFVGGGVFWTQLSFSNNLLELLFMSWTSHVTVQVPDELAEQALKDQDNDTKAAHKQLRAQLVAKVEQEQEAQGWQHVGKQRFPKQTPQAYKADPQQVAKLKARVRAEEEKRKPQQHQPYPHTAEVSAPPSE